MNAVFRAVLVMGLLSLIFGCGSKEKPFQQKDGAWYYESVLIEGADAKSFQVLSEHYAKDKTRVYHGDTYRVSQDYFTTKRVRIKVVERADPATFVYLKQEYAKDRDAIFFEGVAFPVKDVGTFELLDYGFARDRLSGYYHQRPIPGSEGSTFSVIDGHYSKDAKHVFYSDLEPHSGEPLRVNVQLKNAQPASFSALEAGYAGDGGQIYYRGQVLTKDVASFRMLQFDYAKTATQVYHRGTPVAGADAASFETLEQPTDHANAKDRNGSFQQGRRSAKVE